jgi:hypothetical protein
VEYLKNDSLSNIRLGWKSLPRTNSPAYWAHSEVKKKKSAVNMAHRAYKSVET